MSRCESCGQIYVIRDLYDRGAQRSCAHSTGRSCAQPLPSRINIFTIEHAWNRPKDAPSLLRHFHHVPILPLALYFYLFVFSSFPLRNFHVTAILRVIEGRKKIRGEIDRILGKELERKLEGQGCFTFPLFHGVTQFQACVDIALSDCIWMELRQRNWASRSTPVAYAFDQISDCLDSASGLLGGEKSCNGIRHEIHRAVNLPPLFPSPHCAIAKLENDDELYTAPSFNRVRDFYGWKASVELVDHNLCRIGEFHQPRFLLGADWMLRFTAMIPRNGRETF